MVTYTLKNVTQPTLDKIISRVDYRVFAGPDWPSYEQLVAGETGTNDVIQTEVKEFIRMMEETYQAQTLHGDSLAEANQQRQQQKFFDKNYRGATCRVPWETMGVNANGDVFICNSPSWIPKFVGNILDCTDIYQVLNSDIALSIRQEISNGHYTYCNNHICGFFANISPERYQTNGPARMPDPVVQSNDLYVTEIPKNIILDFDYTCNFVCPSCRVELINNNNHHVMAPINDRISEQIKRLVIDQIKDESVAIRWCGGEPFISRVYSDLLGYIASKNKDNIRHIIQTNGSYLQKKSDLVISLLPTVDDMRISFDAACADTYRKIRVNGQWDQLLDNVRWLRQYIDESSSTCTISADFVVQLTNYKEIPAFVKLCQELGIEKINWQKMWNWGTWDPEEFAKHNIYRPDHALYPDLVEVFKQAGQPMSLS